MHKTILALTLLALALPTAVRANEITAEERYQQVKEQTKHTGSTGFDRRHNAYRDYIMETRQKQDAGLADIAPAAGDTVDEKAEQKPQHTNQ